MENVVKKNLSPPTLDLGVDRYSAWRTWRKKWEDFSTITELQKEAYIAAVIRYRFTDDTRNIYESFNYHKKTVINQMLRCYYCTFRRICQRFDKQNARKTYF